VPALGRAREHCRQHLVDGRIQRECPAAVLRLVDGDASLAELLEDVRRLDLLAAEAVGVGDQEHLKTAGAASRH
jgi:hypothetical protein